MNPDLRSLVALQDLEQKIAILQKQIAEIPLKVQALQEQLERGRQEHQQGVAHAQELAKKRRAYEGEVDLMRTKLSKLKDQLMAVKTNKEYTAMLHEIQMAENQIRNEEDKILEIMEEMEGIEGNLKSSEKELQVKTSEHQEALRRLGSSIPALEAEVAALHESRSDMERRVEADLLGRFRRIAEGRKGIALAEARDELCTACHVRIRPQVYADLLHTENIHQCDSCSRILFMRNGL